MSQSLVSSNYNLPFVSNLDSSLFCHPVDGIGRIPKTETRSLWSRANTCALAQFISFPEPNQCPSHELIPYEKSPLTLEEFLDQLYQQNDERHLIALIQNNKDIEIPNKLKIDFIEKCLYRFSDKIIIHIIKILQPKTNHDVIEYLKERHYNIFENILDIIADLYDPSDAVGDAKFLKYLYDAKKTNELTQLWNKHKDYFTSHGAIKEIFSETIPNLGLLKWLHEHGLPSEWFNIPNLRRIGLGLGGVSETKPTPLEEIARQGDVEFLRKLQKDIPMDSILLSDVAFQEEIKDCFVESAPVDLSRFDPSKTMVGQNGCRAVLLTEGGEANSYPGQSAANLAQQLWNSANINSFSIYHNRGHGSIAFSDFSKDHYGFYPDGDPLPKHNLENNGAGIRPEVLAAQAAGYTKFSGVSTGMNPGISSAKDFSLSTTALNSPGQIIGTSKLLNQANGIDSVPCRVINEDWQKEQSDRYNDLVLTVYAPKGIVDAVRSYVMKTKENCENGNETFNLLWNNCVDFARKAVQASGINVDFRDAFQTMQYLRRPGGLANVYTLLRSNQPNIAHNSSLPATIPEAIDRVSRNALIGGVLGIPGIFQGYLVYKGIPKARAGIILAGSRIRRASLAIFVYAAAVGLFFKTRVLRRNGY